MIVCSIFLWSCSDKGSSNISNIVRQDTIHLRKTILHDSCLKENPVDILSLNNELVRYENFPDTTSYADTMYCQDLSNISLFDPTWWNIKHRKPDNKETVEKLLSLNVIVKWEFKTVFTVVNDTVTDEDLIGTFGKYTRRDKENITAYTLGQIAYTRFFESILILLTDEGKDYNARQLIIVNYKGDRLVSVAQIGSYYSDDNHAFRMVSRLNGKYFFTRTEMITVKQNKSDVNLIHACKNRELYTIFYFDKNGLLRFKY